MLHSKDVEIEKKDVFHPLIFFFASLVYLSNVYIYIDVCVCLKKESCIVFTAFTGKKVDMPVLDNKGNVIGTIHREDPSTGNYSLCFVTVCFQRQLMKLYPAEAEVCLLQ